MVAEGKQEGTRVLKKTGSRVIKGERHIKEPGVGGVAVLLRPRIGTVQVTSHSTQHTSQRRELPGDQHQAANLFDGGSAVTVIPRPRRLDSYRNTSRLNNHGDNPHSSTEAQHCLITRKARSH